MTPAGGPAAAPVRRPVAWRRQRPCPPEFDGACNADLMSPPNTAVLDVDATLVDSFYHHAIAWFRVFRRLDLTYPPAHLDHIALTGVPARTPTVSPR